jgi:hypothetical protein
LTVAPLASAGGVLLHFAARHHMLQIKHSGAQSRESAANTGTSPLAAQNLRQNIPENIPAAKFGCGLSAQLL